MGIIITVGREFGSGGREFGRRLAEELGIEYYDKEIITKISERTSLSEEYVKQVVEHTPHNLFPITIGESFTFGEDLVYKNMRDIYHAQSTIICEMAKKADCVIVGRCADYILRDMKPYRIFVHADIESRANRCIERNKSGKETTKKELIKSIKKIDKHRARYYNFYTDLKWGDKSNYDLCVNTTNADIKLVVSSIAKMFK